MRLSPGPSEPKSHDCLTFSESPGPVDWRLPLSMRRIGSVYLPIQALIGQQSGCGGGRRQRAMAYGITRAPSPNVVDDLRAGRLQALLGAYQREQTPVQLLFQQARMAPPKLSSFVDHVASAALAAHRQDLIVEGEKAGCSPPARSQGGKTFLARADEAREHGITNAFGDPRRSACSGTKHSVPARRGGFAGVGRGGSNDRR